MNDITLNTPYSLAAMSVTYSWDLGGRRSSWFDEMDQPKLMVMVFDMLGNDHHPMQAITEEALFPEFFDNGEFNEAAFDAALDAMFAGFDDGYEEVETENDVGLAQNMLGSIGVRTKR